MPRQQQGRYSSESSRRRESQRNRYTSEDAPRNPRDVERDETRWREDEYPSRYRSREMEDRELHQDERGRYRSSGRSEDAGYGAEWPESYRSDFSGEAPQRYRDSWSERQSGPYRSAESGEPLSEDDYRQESRYYRSSPYTGFSGRVSEFGYEDPTWAVPQMGRTGGATGLRYGRPGEGYERMGHEGTDERRGHEGRGPRNYARSDERIREDICDELSDDSLVDARNIDIDVTDGKVTLSGSVAERRMKHRAEDIADECRGVKDVDNRIRVQKRESEEAYTVSDDGGSIKPKSAARSSGANKSKS